MFFINILTNFDTIRKNIILLIFKIVSSIILLRFFAYIIFLIFNSNFTLYKNIKIKFFNFTNTSIQLYIKL